MVIQARGSGTAANLIVQSINERMTSVPEQLNVTPESEVRPAGAATNRRQPIKGAQALVRSLRAVGVDTLFGVPGGAILPAYDALLGADGIRHVLVRHEQGAGHAAQGYAHATGKVGVCLATSGPGATNLVTPLADAFRDSIPIVAITGQVPSTALGTDAFQEIDVLGVTLPITKHGFAVTKAVDIPGVIAEAFRLAASGRPGPVVVDICKDALLGDCEFTWPPALPPFGADTPHEGVGVGIRQALRLLESAARPVLYVGGGIIRAEASPELLRLAEHAGIPIVTTLMGLGAVPGDHPLTMGMPGMHGTVAAVGALQQADLIIAVGVRFDDRVTGAVATFAPAAKVIHVDIDATEISKVRHADVPIVGDCKFALGQMLAAVESRQNNFDFSAWRQVLEGYRRTYGRPDADVEAMSSMSAQHVLRRLSALVPHDAVYTTGVGQHQMWAAQCLSLERPRSLITSGGLGAMGMAIPAAMGAKLALGNAEVWAIDGDGSFQMTQQELATCVAERIPIKVALINNGSLGMVRQWQTLFYDGRHSHSTLDREGHTPNFVHLAEAYGCVGIRCLRAEDVDSVIQQAQQVRDRPVVIEFVVPADEMVWPMVPPGASNDEIKLAKSISPIWNRDLPLAQDDSAAAARAEPSADGREACGVSIVANATPYVLQRVMSALRRSGWETSKLEVDFTGTPGRLEMSIVVSGRRGSGSRLLDQLRNLRDVCNCELSPFA